MTSLRRIAPLPMPAGLVKSAVTGPRPVLRWIAPTELLVDGTYQRDLSRASQKLIRRTIENFAWSRMKPPVVVDTGAGLHIVDGQHTAVAAATIGIPEIPIFVVAVATLDERARAFVGHNTDRVAVSPINIFRALLASGDADATDVANVCRRAGITIRTINQASVPAVGDCMAIGTIKTLVRRRGVILARKALEALVRAKCAPVCTEQIRAAEELICCHGADVDDLTAIVRIDGTKGLLAAHARSREERIPSWRALADRWIAKRRRSAA